MQILNSATAIVAALTALVAALALLWARVEALHKEVDGRLDDLIAEARVIGHAEGVHLARQLDHPEERPVDSDPPSLSPPPTGV